MGRPKKIKTRTSIHKDLKVLRLPPEDGFHLDESEYPEVVIGRDGFHFFNWPSEALKKLLKGLAADHAIWDGLPCYESKPMSEYK